MSLDLTAIRKEWLNQCGPCDYGLVEMGCACPVGDYRPIIVKLADEVERLTKAVQSQTAVANAALAGSARRHAQLDQLRSGLAGMLSQHQYEAREHRAAGNMSVGDAHALVAVELHDLLDGPR